MKHSICGFNHAALGITFKLDYTDAQIIRSVIDFRDTGKMKSIRVDGKEYFWICYTWLLDELPFCGTGSQKVVGRRFSKYVECGLMERHVENGNKTYYRFVESAVNELVSFPMYEKRGTQMEGAELLSAPVPDRGTFECTGAELQSSTIDPSTKDQSTTITQKPLWKTDFKEYLKIVEEAKQKILNSPDMCQRRILKYYPQLDIQKSLELSIDRYWGTEVGWKKKKKCRAAEINMVETLVNNIDKNKVFLSRDAQEAAQQQTAKRDTPQYPNITTLQISVQEEFPEKYDYEHYPPDSEETVWRWMYDKICRVPKAERPAVVELVKEHLEKKYA